MLRRFVNPSHFIKRHVSALYVTGDKAMENFAVLSPFLEIDERMGKFKEIQENVARRKLKMNLSELQSEYEMFSAIEARKKALEDRRVEIAALMKKEATDGLKLEGRDIRDKVKKLKENSYHLEDTFVHHFLRIPNDIHHKTPAEKTILYSFLEKPAHEQVNDGIHELIEYFDPTCYYMKGEAAKFDLQVALDVCDYYNDAGYIKFSNPDFVRSIVPEAAAIDSTDVFLMKEDDIQNKLNLLHLTGSGSMVNYLPFIAKLLVFPTQLPIKLISTGRNYNRLNHYEHQDLYNVVQTTCCQTFIATRDHSSFDEIVEDQMKHWREIFEGFGRHFRIVSYPPESLANSEAHKLGVEMFSSCRGEYIEVGNFSYHSDFISKRLLFNYKLDRATNFPHIFSGTVVNVMKLLVNLVESNTDLRKFV